MQFLNNLVLEEARKTKMKLLERQMQNYFVGVTHKENINCPFCHYVSKNKRFSGVIFDNENGKAFKCFACGIWRKIS